MARGFEKVELTNFPWHTSGVIIVIWGAATFVKILEPANFCHLRTTAINLQNDTAIKKYMHKLTHRTTCKIKRNRKGCTPAEHTHT